jgi:hypothetical protein
MAHADTDQGWFGLGPHDRHLHRDRALGYPERPDDDRVRQGLADGWPAIPRHACGTIGGLGTPSSAVYPARVSLWGRFVRRRVSVHVTG